MTIFGRTHMLLLGSASDCLDGISRILLLVGEYLSKVLKLKAKTLTKPKFNSDFKLSISRVLPRPKQDPTQIVTSLCKSKVTGGLVFLIQWEPGNIPTERCQTKVFWIRLIKCEFYEKKIKENQNRIGEIQ